jgi:hypothetical protein
MPSSVSAELISLAKRQRITKGFIMRALLMVAMLSIAPPEKGDILEMLTEPERDAIAALSNAEQHFVTAFLAQKLPTQGESLSGSKKGDFFMFRTLDRLYVETVVNESNVLALEHVYVPDTDSGVPRAVRRVEELVWLEGAHTDSLRDGKPLPPSVLMCFCVGTKQYPTTDGSSNTVPHIVTVTPENIATLAKPFAEAHGYRIWGEGTERQTLGKYVSASSRKVTVLDVRGKRVEISMSKLSPEDQAWVKTQ